MKKAITIFDTCGTEFPTQKFDESRRCAVSANIILQAIQDYVMAVTASTDVCIDCLNKLDNVFEIELYKLIKK